MKTIKLNIKSTLIGLFNPYGSYLLSLCQNQRSFKITRKNFKKIKQTLLIDINDELEINKKTRKEINI